MNIKVYHYFVKYSTVYLKHLMLTEMSAVVYN